MTNKLWSPFPERSGSDDEYIERPQIVADVDASTDEGGDDNVGCASDGDLPPEHYLARWNNFDEGEYTKEDYKASTTRLLDRTREQWRQYVVRCCTANTTKAKTTQMLDLP